MKADDVYAILLKKIKMGGATSEQIQNAVNDYLSKNPVQPGATEEQAMQINQNKEDIVSIKEKLNPSIISGGTFDDGM